MCKKCGSFSTTPARGSKDEACRLAFSMQIQWTNLKENLNPMDEFVYLQGLKARNLGLPKAFVHKPKTPADEKPLREKLLLSPQPRHEQKIIKRKHLKGIQSLHGTRSPSVIRKVYFASQISSIIMGQDNRSYARCPAGIHIMGQSQKGLRRQRSSTRSRWYT